MLSLVTPNSIFSQYSLNQTIKEVERIFQKNKDIAEVSAYYNQIVSRFDSKKNVDDFFNLNKAIAIFFEKKDKISFAIKYHENCLMYTNHDLSKEIDVYSNLASCYEWSKNNNKAITYADIVIKKTEVNKSYYLFSIVKALEIKAKVYRVEGEVTKALSCLEKANTLATSKFGVNSIIVARNYVKIGECYDLLRDYEKALFFKKKAIKIVQKLPDTNTKKLASFYRSLGLTFQKKEDYFSAINMYDSAIKLLEGKDSIEIGNIYGIKGNCYYYLERPHQAIKFFLAANQKLNDVKSDYSFILFENLTKAGACYTNLGQFSEAAVLIDSALNIVGYDTRKTLPFENIIGSKPSLLITLYFKAKNDLQRYLKSGCEEDLERAHEGYDVCIRLIDYIISSYDDSSSRQYLVERFYYIFESIIEVNYQFYQLRGERKYVDRAMRYMEKSRSILLKEMMQVAKANVIAGIPDTVLARERGLREQIAALESRKYQSERKLPAEQQVEVVFHQLNDSLFNLRNQYWSLLKQLEQRYPAYYDLKHADHSAETAAIAERLLKRDEALVQYFVGDDQIYTLVYRGDGTFYMNKAPVGDLDRNVKDLRESIYNYVLTPSDTLVKAYADGAYGLYQKLLQPISGYLSYRVTIIPDGLLEFLPFEALLTEKPDPNSNFRNWPYCLKKYNFAYAHSLLSLEAMQERQNHPKYRQVLAVAPRFSPVMSVSNPEERRRSFGTLEDNLDEVAGIGALFPTKTLLDTSATVASFKAIAGDYAVLHLATHAKADNEDGEYAYVAFSETGDTTNNNLLYLKNLYTLSLHADMVALSACETGVGKLRRGEGVVSLARGFSYAGANSLVTTLWRISDRESATLMKSYYRELKEGLSKDEALRRAKLEYLDQASGNRAHPFFWAAFVTIGDMAPLNLSNNQWAWWLLALGLLPLGYWVWRKRGDLQVGK